VLGIGDLPPRNLSLLGVGKSGDQAAILGEGFGELPAILEIQAALINSLGDRATLWEVGLDAAPEGQRTFGFGKRNDLSAAVDPRPRLVVRELMRRHEDLRIGRSERVFEALVPAVLEQKVVSREAHRAWRFLLGKFGERAPGPAPAGMRVCPSPRVWARIPSWDWHRAGVEGVRSRTIITAAEIAGRLEEILRMGAADADRRLRSVPGIGPWTSAEIRQRAAGDPDAVSVGDYNLPKAVGWTLAGRITDDAGMLELLAPYAGHRYRVTRLIELGGARPPRHGPRMSVRDYRAF